ncbi:MAG: C39 family peptidase [Candidatus Peregrinibacteria bacterium]
MRRAHPIAIGCIVTFLAVLGSGCAATKPSFPPPDIVLDVPPDIAVSASSVGGSFPSKPVPSPAPSSLLISVPFAPQAPFAVWDPLHEEACEETALIMVHHFLSGTPLSLADAEAEVQAMVEWESAHGYKADVAAAELGAIAQSLYEYRFRVLADVTAENLRSELAAGHPVIIPAFGRALKNPFFSGEGPFYHMLVVIGYTEDGFITNDPGTKRGEKYWYATDILLDALHDWIGVKELIATGPKKALVVWK